MKHKEKSSNLKIKNKTTFINRRNKPLKTIKKLRKMTVRFCECIMKEFRICINQVEKFAFYLLLFTFVGEFSLYWFYCTYLILRTDGSERKQANSFSGGCDIRSLLTQSVS